jgi:hypothetical protein
MPAAPRAPHDLADAVFRVGRAYGMTADRSVYQAVAVTDGRITAVGRSRDELDLLDCPVDDLPSQQPALTLVGGRPVHDPDGLLGLVGPA